MEKRGPVEHPPERAALRGARTVWRWGWSRLSHEVFGPMATVYLANARPPPRITPAPKRSRPVKLFTSPPTESRTGLTYDTAFMPVSYCIHGRIQRHGVNNTEPTNNDFSKLAELIKDVRVAMMQTFTVGGSGGGLMPVHVRPMYTQKLDPATFSGELWFFTDASSEKIREIESNEAVLLTYASPDKNRYVVLSGRGHCERNPAKAKELWNVHAKGWWPDGPESPSLELIRVTVSKAEYWDGPSNLSYMISLLKAVGSGERIELSTTHGHVG